MFRSRAERKVEEAGYDPARLPPGQYLTEKWPVLHAGDVPSYPADLAGWDFRVHGEVETPITLTWDELSALPRIDVTQDIHCVTRWSRFDTTFSGVPWSALRDLVGQRPSAHYAIAHAEAGIHGERPGVVSRGRGRNARDARRRRAARARARLAAQARDPGEVLLEEREMASRDRAARHGRAGVLGALRLPQRRGSLERAALFVLWELAQLERTWPRRQASARERETCAIRFK